MFNFITNGLALQINNNLIEHSTDKVYLNEVRVVTFSHADCFEAYKKFKLIQEGRKLISEELRNDIKQRLEHGCLRFYHRPRDFMGLFSGKVTCKNVTGKENRSFKTLNFLSVGPLGGSCTTTDLNDLPPLDNKTSHLEKLKVFDIFQLSSTILNNRIPVSVKPSDTREQLTNCTAMQKVEYRHELNFESEIGGLFLLSHMIIRLDTTTSTVYISFGKMEAYVQCDVN